VPVQTAVCRILSVKRKRINQDERRNLASTCQPPV
jgi:hypothetical protein